MLLIGDDWAEDHHNVEIQDESGRQLAAAQLPDGVEGIAKLHELIARRGGEHWTQPRWWSGSLVGAGAAGLGLPDVRDQPAAGCEVQRIIGHLDWGAEVI